MAINVFLYSKYAMHLKFNHIMQKLQNEKISESWKYFQHYDRNDSMQQICIGIGYRFFHRWEYNYNVQRHQKKELISITFNITSLNDIYHEYMKNSNSYLKTLAFPITIISTKYVARIWNFGCKYSTLIFHQNKSITFMKPFRYL